MGGAAERLLKVKSLKLSLSALLCLSCSDHDDDVCGDVDVDDNDDNDLDDNDDNDLDDNDDNDHDDNENLGD